MAYYSGFQSNAFQNNAFQIKTGAASQTQQNSAGFPAYDSTKDRWSRQHDKRPISERVDLLSTRIESLPEPVQAAIETAVNIESKSTRNAEMKRLLAGIERQFLATYIALMESYREAWIEEQLAIELERKRLEEEEEAVMILLLSI